MLHVFDLTEVTTLEVNKLMAHPMMRREEAAWHPDALQTGQRGWHLLASSKCDPD